MLLPLMIDMIDPAPIAVDLSSAPFTVELPVETFTVEITVDWSPVTTSNAGGTQGEPLGLLLSLTMAA